MKAMKATKNGGFNGIYPTKRGGFNGFNGGFKSSTLPVVGVGR